MKNINFKCGFTLLELLVALSIFIVLSVIAYGGVQKVITTKQKAYELWRSEKNNISTVLRIPISKRSEFEYNFVSSFDLFKDKEQVEHHKILNFVSDNLGMLSVHYDDASCIDSIFKKFKETKTSLLGDDQLKAAIFAAYVEIKG